MTYGNWGLKDRLADFVNPVREQMIRNCVLITGPEYFKPFRASAMVSKLDIHGSFDPLRQIFSSEGENTLEL